MSVFNSESEVVKDVTGYQQQQKNNLPKARDESVQKEIEFQNQREIQPLGNEGTIRMLDEQNAKKSLDFSDEIDPNDIERMSEKSFPGGKINKISNEIASSFDESEDEKSEDDKSEDSMI